MEALRADGLGQAGKYGSSLIRGAKAPAQFVEALRATDESVFSRLKPYPQNGREREKRTALAKSRSLMSLTVLICTRHDRLNMYHP
jgi:hypothetical protein